MPYTAISSLSKDKAIQPQDDELIISPSGVLTSRGLDGSFEHMISLEAWLKASKAMVKRTRHHHGDEAAEALQAHHENVETLLGNFGWNIALAYDINQRKTAAVSENHDIAPLDHLALSLITAGAAALHRSNAGPGDLGGHHSHNTHPLALKRGAPAHSQAHGPSKRARTGATQKCFRCGSSGHMPADCRNQTTSAGKPVAKLDTSSERTSPHALIAPDGRAYCYPFARSSSCHWQHNCKFYHGCSLCRANSHGALSCTSSR